MPLGRLPLKASALDSSADKSSKAGKDAQLLVAGISPEEQLFLPEAHEKALFFESLATNVPEGDRLLKASIKGHQSALSDSMGGLRVSLDGRGARVAAALTPVVLHKPPEARDAAEGPRRVAVAPGRHAQLIHFVLGEWAEKSGLTSCARSCSREREVCAPDLFRHLRVMRAILTPIIAIRQTGRLTVCLGPENRWCAHVQRPHKSNGTYLCIDRHRCSFAQYCFDVECRAAGFRGSDRLPIPPDLCVLAADELPPSPPKVSFADQFPEDEGGVLVAALPRYYGHDPSEEEHWEIEEQWALQEEPWIDEPQPLHRPQQTRQLRQQKLRLQRRPLVASTDQPRATTRTVTPPPASPPVKPHTSLSPPPLVPSPPSPQSCSQTPPSPLYVPSSSQAGVSSKPQPMPPSMHQPMPRPHPQPTTPSISMRVPDEMQSTPSPTNQSTPSPANQACDANQSTPSPANQACDAMQSTPSPANQASDAMQCADVAPTVLQENLSLNKACQPRRTWSTTRSQREARRPADGGRTPRRDEATPLRGREHPASTPSPTFSGLGRVQEDQARWCMPLHDYGLFGSPLIDPPDSSVQVAQADDWACAACTLVNAADATRCVVCDALKGSTLASAATLALNMNHGARVAPTGNRRAAEADGSHSCASSVSRPAAQKSHRQTAITNFIRAKPR